MIFCILAGYNAGAQYIPLSHSYNLEYEKQGYRAHTAVKPVLINPVSYGSQNFFNLNKVDSNILEVLDSNRSWIVRKLFRENLVNTRHAEDEFWLVLNPLLNVHVGKDFSDTTNAETLYTNTRGVEVRGGITNRLFFSSRIYENQSFLPDYIDGMVASTGAVSGQGRPKIFKVGGYDYSQATGSISLRVLENWVFQLGNGKHFIGHGYRSMLLSDQAFSYPYMRIEGKMLDKKLQYSFISAILQGGNRLPATSSTEPRFERKGGSFITLNYQPTRWLEVGVFESTMWKAQDSLRSVDFNPLRLNPIPFVSSGVNGLNGSNNVLLGLNAQVRPIKEVAAYMQLAIDQFNTSKLSYQVGVKAYWWKLNGRLEYNSAQSLMYRGPNLLQAHAHGFESLAHPLGSHFQEYVGVLEFRHKRWVVKGKVNRSYQNTTFSGFSGIETVGDQEHAYNRNVTYLEGELGWIMNPVNKMTLFGRGIIASDNGWTNPVSTRWMMVGVKTNLRNIYYDY